MEVKHKKVYWRNFYFKSLPKVITICFVVAIAEVYKNEGNDEYKKNNFNGAIFFYTEGIKVNCKYEDLNAKLYSNRAAAHFNLGNKLLFIGCFKYLIFGLWK